MNRFVTILVISCLAFIASATDYVPTFSEDIRKQLASLDYDSLPVIFHQKSGHSGWCCANEQPVQTIQRTRVGKEIIIVTQVIKVGYGPCGVGINIGDFNIGLDKKCTIYDTRTRQQIQYHVEHYDVPNPQSCPDNYVRCCANYIDVAGTCFDIFMVDQHLDLLVSIGLLSTVKPLIG